MKRNLSIVLVILAASTTTANAALVNARWGGEANSLTHPGTLKITSDDQATRLTFDLSAVPKGAEVHQARLYCFTNGRQPREEIRIFIAGETDAAGKAAAPAGKPLALVPPWYQSFDATEAVRLWVAEPEKNRGFVITEVGNLVLAGSYLEVRYAGKPAEKLPPQVDRLKVIHHDGQTFLTWQELPIFRPAPDKIVWIDDYVDSDKAISQQPGTGKMGSPRVPGIRLDTLRDLQGLKVRTTPGISQEMPPLERIRDLPDVRYRVYCSPQRITAETLHAAVLVGEAEPLSAYDEGMVKIYSRGEYYNKHEQPDNVIGTFCVADFQGVLPGHALYVHTPGRDGNAYYAVTAMQDGVENTVAISSANSLAQPVQEKADSPQPVKYYTIKTNLRGRSDPAMLYQHLFWLAPPMANLPDNTPKRIGVAVADDYQAPGPLLLNLGGAWAEQPGSIMLAIQPAGDVCYNDGQGTLKSYRKSKLENFPERYFFHMVKWALANWQVDPARISGTSGMSLHLAIRHPELFGVFWPDRPNFFQFDVDQKWNPDAWSLPRRIGPPELVRAPDGAPGWEIFNMAWYLKQNPAKDIPFIGVLLSVAKDTGHGAEYGWQDDPRGLAALRDFRQPFVAQWGGGGSRVAREVSEGLFQLRWDKSVPAFSHCSLDNNPGNGDPSDGDPWGQINGYLFWEYSDIVDEPAQWEMTVYLVASSPADACTVDITPRHCRKFKARPGEKFAFTNTSLADDKVIESGELTADQWGLVTVPMAVVNKGHNRIKIVKKG